MSDSAQDVRVRTATPQDAEAALAIYAHYVKNTAITFDYDVPSLEDFETRLVRTLERYPYLVAERGDKVVGYAYASPFVGRAAYDWSSELTVYVAPDVRGHGVGRVLYVELERLLGAMGVRTLYACIGYPEVEDEYLTYASVRFHERMGFAVIGRHHQCGNKFGRWYDMVWMEKAIGPHDGAPKPIVPFPQLG